MGQDTGNRCDVIRCKYSKHGECLHTGPLILDSDAVWHCDFNVKHGVPLRCRSAEWEEDGRDKAPGGINPVCGNCAYYIPGEDKTHPECPFQYTKNMLTANCWKWKYAEKDV